MSPAPYRLKVYRILWAELMFGEAAVDHREPAVRHPRWYPKWQDEQRRARHFIRAYAKRR